VRELVTGFDQEALLHRWRHADLEMDSLAAAAIRIAGAKASRTDIFKRLWALVSEYETPPLPSRATVPYLDEPWYC
jgi:hypothetical protein